MNNRQKKKLYKQTLIKVKKLHPQKGDVICFQYNIENIFPEAIGEVVKMYDREKLFGEATLVAIPTNIKLLHNKDEVQTCIDKLQSIVDGME